MEFSIKDFFSKCDQIRRKLRIWSHLLKKSLIVKLQFLCSVIKLCESTSKLGGQLKQTDREIEAIYGKLLTFSSHTKSVASS